MRIMAVGFLFCLFLSSGLRAGTISEADLRRHIETLASDAFEGRQPGTAGENRAVNYIATQWAQTGMRPAEDTGSWYAPVALVERIPETSRLAISSGWGDRAGRRSLPEVILRSGEDSFRNAALPLVFAGYGVAGADAPPVAGKLALLPVNPPSGSAQDFRARKSQLIRSGVAGVIGITDEPDGWARSERLYRRGSTALAGAEHHAALEGLMSGRAFRQRLAQAGLDPDGLLADSAAIAVVDLGLTADATARTRLRRYTSHNVLGKIPGRDPASGAVLFTAHWDHFGVCRVADAQDPGQDRICNGAVDNASGVALLIEVARRLSGEPHDRDLYFLATTAEEKGLLGARAFLENPPVARDSLVAVFNADTVALAAKGDTVAVIGLRESGLQAPLAAVAAQEGRAIDDSGTADAYLRRQDGYVFLEQGIPALMVTSAFADAARLRAYIDGPYHDVSDEADGNLVLTGAAADANFHVALGRYFSSTGTYPGIATSGSADN